MDMSYTNHSLRATSITGLDYKTFEARYIMAIISGHKSASSLKNYRNKQSNSRIHEMSTAITSAIIDQTDNEESDDLTVQQAENIEIQEVDGEIFVNHDQLENLMELDDKSLQEHTLNIKTTPDRQMPVNIQNTSVAYNSNSTTVKSPFQNLAGTFTPYITNCVVNFAVNMENK